MRAARPSSVAGWPGHRPARAGRARVHEPTDALLPTEPDDDARGFDVDPLELRRRRVVAVERRDVEDGVAAADHGPQPLAVEEVDPVVPDADSSGAQLADDVPADEPACAGHVDVQRATNVPGPAERDGGARCGS